MRNRWFDSAVLVCLLTTLACEGPAQQGLAPTPPGDGPQIVFEPLDKPEAQIPLPNDSATRLVDDSPTGRRLNLAVDSPLAKERKLRKQLNRLDGFSVVSPISVSFDAPLDLTTVSADSVLLYDVTPSSPDYGRTMPLDLGQGAFPVQMKPRSVFAYEDEADLPDLVFGPDNEVDGERIYHYEVETHTLLFRPLFPLRPKTTYAVVLKDTLLGEGGEPVQSPFPFVHHMSQHAAVDPVAQWVEGGTASIAFTWTFTTRSVTDDVVAIREGLDGEGSLSWLAESYPPELIAVDDLGMDHDGNGTVEGLPADERDHRYILKPNLIPLALGAIGGVVQGLDTLDFKSVDYVVFGTFRTVDLRSAEDDAIWVNRAAGTVDHQSSEVPFALAVPHATDDHPPPFPVILYNHGARTSRLEMILVAEEMARAGFAVVSMDAVGHGPFGGDLRVLLEREASEFPPELVAFLAGVVAQSFLGSDYVYDGKDLDQILTDLETNGLWRALFVDGRSTDLDGDGVLLGGDGYFVPNPFQMASNAIQTIVDNMMLLRLLRRFREDAVPQPGIEVPADASYADLEPFLQTGDFNADGVLDIGGPNNTYYAMGTSLGGIHTSILMAVEPALRTGVAIVSGGGMVDIMVRTSLAEAVDAILAEPLGPALVGCPLEVEGEETTIALSWNGWSLKCRDPITIAMAEEQTGLERLPMVPGGTVELTNLRLQEEGGEAYAPDASHISAIADDGGFSVTVAADVGDPLELIMRDSANTEVHRLEIEAKRAGLGRVRNTPRIRRLINIAQTAMDAGDPLAYARHLIHEPLAGAAPRNVLHLADIGDRTVPFSTMVAWDRAAGLHGLDEDDALSVLDAFLDHDALRGQKPFWDIDDLLKTGDGIGPLPVIETESGVSGVRYPATDDHEYIAFPDPDAEFDWTTYSRNQIVRFLMTDGAEITDDLCLEDSSCDWLSKN